MNLSFIKALILSSFLSVTVAYAANADFSSLGNAVNNFTGSVVKAVGYLFLALATVVFFWGMVQFIWNSREGDSNATKNGKQFMMWGIIGLFVMFSIWGIIKFAQGAIGNGIDSTTITIPKLNFDGGSGSSGGTGGGGLGGGTAGHGQSCSSSADCQTGMACGYPSGGGGKQCIYEGE